MLWTVEKGVFTIILRNIAKFKFIFQERFLTNEREIHVPTLAHRNINHTHKDARKHAPTQVRMHARTHGRTHARTLAHLSARTHTRAHTQNTNQTHRPGGILIPQLVLKH